MPIKLLNIQPRRGRGPAWLKFEGEENASTFDSEIIHAALAMVGGLVDVDIAKVDRRGKTYRNLTGIRLVEPPPEQPTTALSQAPAPPTPRTVPMEAFQAFDQADDALIAERLKGRALSAMVYHFKQGGQTVYGLGVDGAEACKRELAKNGEIIDEETVRIEKETPTDAYFVAKAVRFAYRGTTRVMLDSALGTKRQSKTTAGGATNPFWFEQGCTKAVRNAILRLTPELIKQQVIEAYKSVAVPVGASASQSTEVAEPVSALPPPQSSLVAEEPSTSAFKAFKIQALKLQNALGVDTWVTALAEMGYESLGQVPPGEYGKVIAALYVRVK